MTFGVIELNEQVKRMQRNIPLKSKVTNYEKLVSLSLAAIPVMHI